MSRRTIRRYARELYPEPGEWDVQPLEEAVPALYAEAVGMGAWGSDWFELDLRDKAQGALAVYRTHMLIQARREALMADAMLQGLTGSEAWTWVEERAMDETGECVHDRAVHYGVPVDQVKPYPVLAERAKHNHHDTTGNATGWGVTTTIGMPESECPDCTEEVSNAD